MSGLLVGASALLLWFVGVIAVCLALKALVALWRNAHPARPYGEPGAPIDPGLRQALRVHDEWAKWDFLRRSSDWWQDAQARERAEAAVRARHDRNGHP